MLVGLVAGLGGAACTPSPPRPDVVVIVIDTLRADRLPFYDEARDTAPFLDSLARRGLVFDDAWATSSWTGPATASIFTGLHPNEHGVELGLRAGLASADADGGESLNRIPEALDSLPQVMRELGYRTYGATANPNIDRRLGFERGFDRFARFDPRKGKGAGPLLESILEWRDELVDGPPFFLYLHLADPHGPYQRHAEWITSSDPPPANPLDDIVAYDSEIRFADEHLRRLFDALALADDTLVVMTADHGQEFLDHGQRGHGMQLYSELTRVPLFIHYPPDPRLQGRVSGNVSNADILATLRDLLGADRRGPGTSLLAAGGEGADSRAVFMMRKNVARDQEVRLYSVVVGRHKLIRHEPSGRIELYDVVADPREQHDLAGSLPEIEARLGRAIDLQRAHAKDTGHSETGRYTPTRELTEMLEQLGYAEGDVNAGGDSR